MDKEALVALQNEKETWRTTTLQKYFRKQNLEDKDMINKPVFYWQSIQKRGPGYFSFKKQQGFHIHPPFKSEVCDSCQLSLFMQLALDSIC